MAGMACETMALAIFAGWYYLKRWELWNRKVQAVFLMLSGVIFLGGGFLMEQYGYHPLKILRYWILMYGLLLLGIFDGDRKRIPNRALLLLLAVRTLFLFGECIMFKEIWMEIVVSACAGLGGGSGLLLLTAFFAKKGIGMGDVKLVGTAGYYLGFQVLMSDLIITMVLMLLVGAGGLLTKRISLKTELPFAPFLAAGTILTLLAGC